MENTNKYPFTGIVPGSILKDNSIVGRREMSYRRSHGFIIKLHGATEYRRKDKCWLLSAGQILFVPKGSSYFIKEVVPGYSYVVNFESTAPLPAEISLLTFPQGFDIAPPAEKMYHSWQKENIYAALSCLYSLLDKSAAEEGYTTSREKKLLAPVMDYLAAHLTDPELDLELLPRLAGVSQGYLRRLFKKVCGVSPAAYVIRQRITLAKQLLLSGEEHSIAQVAASVGYSDPLYFSRLFKKHFGLSPVQYKNAHMDDLF